jgi:2-oxoglutarate dehydrogenase E1 component
MLRRQAIRPLRKPLVVMSPKSLLRHKDATSTLEDLANGHFYNVLDDTDELDKTKVERIVMCSGKVFYDLRAARREREMNNVAIIRLEQLYPFPEDELMAILSQYPNIVDAIWCQEEPMNQGAWYQIRHHLEACTGDNHKLAYTGRALSASPAAGSYNLHMAELHQFVNQALTID